MSLTIDHRKIRDYQELHADESQLQISTTIGFATMPIGLGEITEKNVGEFFARLDYLQRAAGGFLSGPEGPYFITADDVIRRIGMRTNVFPAEPRSKWLKRVVGQDFDLAARRVTDKVAQQAEAHRDAVVAEL